MASCIILVVVLWLCIFNLSPYQGICLIAWAKMKIKSEPSEEKMGKCACFRIPWLLPAKLIWSHFLLFIRLRSRENLISQTEGSQSCITDNNNAVDPMEYWVNEQLLHDTTLICCKNGRWKNKATSAGESETQKLTTGLVLHYKSQKNSAWKGPQGVNQSPV